MRHMHGALLTIGGLLLMFAAGIRADSLQLKNGNMIQGKYMGGTERAVQFEVNGKMRIYEIEQILSISFGAASVDGGMPSKSAAAGRNGNAEHRSAAKSTASRSAAKQQVKPARILDEPNLSQAAGKVGECGSVTVQVKRSLRADWTPAGDCQWTQDSSFTGGRFAWLAEGVDALPS